MVTGRGSGNKTSNKMATRSKAAAKKATMTPEVQITKLQKEVIHWVRRNVPTKETKFLHAHKVAYFTGSKAVDALVTESPWARSKLAKPEDAPIVFDDRDSAIEFMDEMLKHKMFHRAKKIPVTEKDKKRGKSKKDKEDGDKSKDGGDTAPNSPDAKNPAKKRRKIRLDMHLEQVFMDSSDAFVWIYDPLPWYYWVGGSAIVLGIIAICLFPLWPQWSRKGVHYISVAAAGFLVFIIALGVLKYIVFGLLFILSGGKLKFWIFPNLTEDVGFFESFMPLYDYTYTGKKKRKEKDSDDEESDDESEDEDNENKKKDEDSEDSTSRKSSTGKDFEMVNQNDTDADD